MLQKTKKRSETRHVKANFFSMDAVRRHFPHARETIYLNHAAVGPLSKPVVEALQAFIEQRHGANIENYFDVLPLLEETRARLGRMVGAGADRIAFMPNTSYGLNVLALGLDWKPGDRIAVPGCEFPANVYPFLNLARLGVEVDFIPHREGTLRLEDIDRMLGPRTRLLSVSWVQFLSGFRLDLAEVGRRCRAKGVLFSVDAIQGLGALRPGAGMEACGIDFLASGGHKWLLGPQGTGFLYVSEALQERLVPAVTGWLNGPVDWDDFYDYRPGFHAEAARFQPGTLNSLGLVGLNAALGLYFQAGPAACEAEVLARSRELAGGLAALGLERYGTHDPAHASGIVTFRHPEAEALYHHLRSHGVAASLRNRMLRFSPTYYNTADEIRRVLDLVAAKS